MYKGQRCNLTFFRDSNQNEVDLIIESHGKTIPVEIKASQTMDSAFFKTLVWFNEQIHNKQEAIVVYAGDQLQIRSIGKVLPWTDLDSISS